MADRPHTYRIVLRTVLHSVTATAITCMLVGCADEKAEPAVDTAPLKVLGRTGKVSLKANLEKGKKTVFDFYSDTCGPCIALMPRMIELDRQRDDVRVVAVDLTPGRSTLDEEAPMWEETGLLTIPYTPYYIIYSPDGRIRARGEEANAIVHHWLQELD